MFDWLFGDGGKGLQQQKQQLDQAKNQQTYNREMGNAMSSILADPANAELVSQAGSDFINSWTNQGNSLRSAANQSQTDIDSMSKAYDQAKNADKYNYFGNGIIGSILNPIAQTATAVGDLATGNYSKNNRDWVSDLGAAAETALNFIPGASALKAVNGATKLSKGALALNALTGAGASMADAYRQGGKDTNFNDALSQAGTGALFGAAVPAAIGVGGNFVKNRGGWRNMLPQSKLGKAAVIGGGLYGGSRLLGGLNGSNQAQSQGGYY